MTSPPLRISPPGTAAAWGRALAGALAVLAVILTIPVRFVISRGQPLWLDETWTGAIAARPSLVAVVRQAQLDVNAPLYYLFIHLWSGLFGVSDAALRAPSALFGAAAPLLPLLVRGTGLSLGARLGWAALLALWAPGLYLSGEARGYTLLVLLATAAALAFVRLLRAPSTARAAAWAGLSALAILTHYHALVLAGLQGLAYLAIHRREALRTWPAALLFLPPFAWIAFHLPRIAEFMRPDVAWYPLLSARRVERALFYPLGGAEAARDLGGLLLLAGLAALASLAFKPPGPRGRMAWAPLVAVGAALLGAGVVIGMGFVRPSFTERYLVPFVPSILLGVALVAAGLGRRTGLVIAGAVLAFAWTAVPYAHTQATRGWRWYNWEVASRDLMRGRPDRLVFVWDHPASPVLERDQLDMIGGFFFRRAGAPVEVRSVVLDAAADPNPRLLAELQAPRAALIWAYDRGVLGTAARRFPPRLQALDPSLTCRNYGRGSIGVLACDRVGSVNTTKP